MSGAMVTCQLRGKVLLPPSHAEPVETWGIAAYPPMQTAPQQSLSQDSGTQHSTALHSTGDRQPGHWKAELPPLFYLPNCLPFHLQVKRTSSSHSNQQYISLRIWIKTTSLFWTALETQSPNSGQPHSHWISRCFTLLTAMPLWFLVFLLLRNA